MNQTHVNNMAINVITENIQRLQKAKLMLQTNHPDAKSLLEYLIEINSNAVKMDKYLGYWR